MVKDKAYWLNERKKTEALFTYTVMRATKKTPSFVKQTAKLVKRLEKITAELKKLEKVG